MMSAKPSIYVFKKNRYSRTYFSQIQRCEKNTLRDLKIWCKHKSNTQVKYMSKQLVGYLITLNRILTLSTLTLIWCFNACRRLFFFWQFFSLLNNTLVKGKLLNRVSLSKKDKHSAYINFNVIVLLPKKWVLCIHPRGERFPDIFFLFIFM